MTRNEFDELYKWISEESGKNVITVDLSGKDSVTGTVIDRKDYGIMFKLVSGEKKMIPYSSVVSVGESEEEEEENDKADNSEKVTGSPLNGVITKYFMDNGWGFVDYKYYFNISDILNTPSYIFDYKVIEGRKVSYDIVPSTEKPGKFCAVNISLLDTIAETEDVSSSAGVSDDEKGLTESEYTQESDADTASETAELTESGTNDEPRTGIITKFYHERYFGFIDYKYFFSVADVINASDLMHHTGSVDGSKVTYNLVPSTEKPGKFCAVNISLLDTIAETDGVSSSAGVSDDGKGLTDPEYTQESDADTASETAELTESGTNDEPRTGIITKFFDDRGFGFIDGKYYFKIFDVKNRTAGLYEGCKVSYDIVPSTDKPGTFRAVNIRLIVNDAGSMSYPTRPVALKTVFSGIITAFIEKKSLGYIDGKYFFYRSDVKSNTAPKPGAEVTYNTIPSPKKPGTFQAVNIHITEDPTSYGRLSVKDMQNYSFVTGETITVIDMSDKQLTGQFIRKSENSLVIEFMDEEKEIDFFEVKTILFSGVITSLNVMSNVGTINEKYKFSLNSITDSQFLNMLKRGSFRRTLCMYTVVSDYGNIVVSSVSPITKKMLNCLKWNEGKVEGLYSSNYHITIDKKYRFYLTSRKDSAIEQFVEDKNFLWQEVFYKYIAIPYNDGRNDGDLLYAAVDLRSKYVSAELKAESCTEAGADDGEATAGTRYYAEIEINDKEVQTSKHYRVDCDMPEDLPGKETICEVLCAENEETVVAVNVLEKMPDHSTEINDLKHRYEQEMDKADADGDYLRQIELNEKLLDMQLINPDKTVGIIFKICVKNHDYGRILETAEEFGYMLMASAYNGILMQAQLLCGNADSASEYAKKYLTTADPKTALYSFALGIYKKEKTADELAAFILDPANSAINDGGVSQNNESGEYSGVIGYLGGSGEGYILWEGRKLPFSRKDIMNPEDYRLTSYSIAANSYNVSFEINDIHPNNLRAKNVVVTGEVSGKGDEAVSDEFNITDASGNYAEFLTDTFDLKDVSGYLSKKDQNNIKDGIYCGTEEDAKKLIDQLSSCYEKKNSIVFRNVTAENRPKLLVAAAKIFSQYSGEYDGEYWKADRKNKLVANYVSKMLNVVSDNSVAETEYMCESAWMGTPDKNRLIQICFSPFFRKNSKAGNVISGRCKDAEGLLKSLLNSSEDIFSEVIYDISDEVITSLNRKIAGTEYTDGTDGRYSLESHYDNYAIAIKEFRSDLEINSLDDITSAYNNLNEFYETYSRFMFETDMQLLYRLIKLVSDIIDCIDNDDVEVRVNGIRDSYSKAKISIDEIENSPSKFTVELLYKFLVKLSGKLVEYLNDQYVQFRPVLTAEHHAFHSGNKTETVSVSNKHGLLMASNVKIGNITPILQRGTDFAISAVRTIRGQMQSVRGSDAIEIEIPIEGDFADDSLLEISLDLTYDYRSGFDKDEGTDVYDDKTERNLQIQIPVSDNFEPLYGNPYSDYSGGDAMKPEDPNAKKMFFGRDKDIDEIYKMITDNSGRLAEGSMTAIYGQKRCGKSSVMNFLGEKIRQNYKNAIVLTINAQEFGAENFFRNILYNIITEFSIQLYKNRELETSLRESGITVPEEQVLGENGISIFNGFFKKLKALHPEYSVVVMVDEFTQAYLHMKKHLIEEDFLNKWRAMVQTCSFVNVIVGQDFMDKFITDEDITSQNFGGAVNGFGTLNRKRLTYLDKESAREMMENPVRFADGNSRYLGTLGDAAIRRIHELTGDSAFYLMKFCNVLVDYMMQNNEKIITRNLVDTVVEEFAFDTVTNPLEKKDFDPIYNEFSYEKSDSAESDSSLNVKGEINNTYNILKEIADKASDITEKCEIARIEWPDAEEKEKLLKSLMVRGVLTDEKGKDIVTNDIENMRIKIKVGIFGIWLKQRG